jgi:hypothetical protein
LVYSQQKSQITQNLNLRGRYSQLSRLPPPTTFYIHSEN